MPSERFDELRERLLRAGIAPRHVRRYVTELRDHFDDLVREGTEKGLTRNEAEEAAGNRIGSDDALSAVMLSRPGLRSVTARFPWLVFGFGPPLMHVAATAAAILVEVGLIQLYLAFIREPGGRHLLPPDWFRASVAAWEWMVMYVMPLLVATAICVVGMRQRSSLVWIILGAVLICILGGFNDLNSTWSDLPGARSGLSLSLVGPSETQRILPGLFRAGVSMAVVSVVYWLWLRREEHRAPRTI